MKNVLLASVALAAVVAALPAGAADLGSRPYYKAPAPAYMAPVYYWTGFYVGGHIGGAFSSNNNFGGLATGNNSDGRFLGGNVGAVFPGGFAYSNSQRGLGSVTGRVGYTWGPGLLYVKGGYAFSDNNEHVTFGGAAIPFVINGDHRDGYTVGAGLEYMFAPNWSALVEYQYYNFGKANFTSPGALIPFGSFTTDDHTVKAGVNYRFNWATAPVAARY